MARPSIARGRLGGRSARLPAPAVRRPTSAPTTCRARSGPGPCSTRAITASCASSGTTRAYDESRVFELAYRFRGLVEAHDDTVDVFWQVWGDQWEGLARRARRHARPAAVRWPVSQQARVCAPRPRRGRGDAGPGAHRACGADRAPNSSSKRRALLPRDVLERQPGWRSRSFRGPAFDRIQADEAQDYAQAKEVADRVGAVLDHKGLAAFGTVAAGGLLGLLIWPLAWLRYGREPNVPGTAIEYVPEPPDDAPPAVAQCPGDPGRVGRRRRPAGRHAARSRGARAVPRPGERHRTGSGPAAGAGRPQGPGRAVGAGGGEDRRAGDPVDGSEAVPLGELSARLKKLSTSQREANASRKAVLRAPAGGTDRSGGAASSCCRPPATSRACWGCFVFVAGGALGVVGLVRPSSTRSPSRRCSWP